MFVQQNTVRAIKTYFQEQLVSLFSSNEVKVMVKESVMSRLNLTAAEYLLSDDSLLSESDLLLDGGSSKVGLESTIIDCTTVAPRVLRPGAITFEMIEEFTGKIISKEFSVSNIRVSGSLENHYAPKAIVILDQEPFAGSGFIALESTPTPAGVIRLASPKSVEEFARVLFESLRDGDRQNLDTIHIEQPTGNGLAVAIRDRLERSAKGR